MKALITRASAIVVNGTNKLVANGFIEEGAYKGTEFAVWHTPYRETEGQRTATRIFLERGNLEREDFGKTDLAIECEIDRVTETVDGVPYTKWEFAAPTRADESVLAAVFDEPEAPAAAPTARRKR